MAGETRIPAKQLENKGTFTELKSRLLENEAGWCSDDNVLYIKNGDGNLVPLSKIVVVDSSKNYAQLSQIVFRDDITGHAGGAIPVLTQPQGEGSEGSIYLYPECLDLGKDFRFGGIWNGKYYWAICKAPEGPWESGDKDLGDATKAWVNEDFQKKLVAGANITIDALTNTISAVIPAVTYEAGDGINIEINTIECKVDDTLKFDDDGTMGVDAWELVAGEHISIEADETHKSYTISADGGTSGKSYTGVDGVIVDNTEDEISLDWTKAAKASDVSGLDDRVAAAETRLTIDEAELSRKVDKIDAQESNPFVYGRMNTEAGGTEGKFTMCSTSALASTVAQRNAKGQIFTAAPEAGLHAATKAYVDSGDSTAATKVKQDHTAVDQELALILKGNNTPASATAPQYFNTGFHANPSTGILSAPKISEGGTLLSDKYKGVDAQCLKLYESQTAADPYVQHSSNGWDQYTSSGDIEGAEVDSIIATDIYPKGGQNSAIKVHTTNGNLQNGGGKPFITSEKTDESGKIQVLGVCVMDSMASYSALASKDSNTLYFIQDTSGYHFDAED